jgi:tetratricopeptide (TPR) repeat protein
MFGKNLNLKTGKAIGLAACISIGSNSFVYAADAVTNASTDKTDASAKAAAVKTAAQSSAAASTPSSASTNTPASASTSTAASSSVNTAASASTPTSNASGSAASAATQPATNNTTTSVTTGNPTKWRPGMELSVETKSEDLVPTDDVELARKQVEAYPESAEAAFILAVALTRTSRVEDALKAVQRAKKLANNAGGPAYFDKMINTYEEMLTRYPNENRVRYGLAWAYYMKAYLLASNSRKEAAWIAKNGDPMVALAKMNAAKNDTKAGATPNAAPTANGAAPNAAASSSKDAVPLTGDAAKAAQSLVADAKAGKKLDFTNIAGVVGAVAQGNSGALPKLPSVMDGVQAKDIPQINKYYELALSKLDDLLAQKPDDIWAQEYRAHLRAEYSGNISDSMKVWTQCSEKYPNNPASYLFLGEGYLKMGNLKESINNVSKAIALRAMGY